MALIGLSEVSLGFGGPLLLEGINFQVEPGERIGILGRNGMGKTTLLKLLNADLQPDEGSVARQQNLCTAYLPQEVPQGVGGPVSDIVASGLKALVPGSQAEDEWQHQLQVEQVISRMELDAVAEFETLSAGMKRRVLLARGLACNPDVLLLDEPTNHLDISSITWLEDFLIRWGGTLLFVTHDRAFLQRLATRIIELDRGKIYDWKCSYPVFLARKEAMLASELEQNALFDKKLAQEEAWIRRGIEARRTRNEGRVRALKRLREVRRERREQPGKVRMQIQEEKRSGSLVIEAENLTYAYENKKVIDDFSMTIQRGDRVGIIGPNGSGKTTLLRILLGELKPQRGEVRLGTNLDVAYFDQLRAQLDENKSILDNVGQGSDTVTINGKTRNLVGYLSDFLFSRERVHAPIHVLSGGERNRLLLARLFSMPANLLVMDEPTNDLDIETLELLEDRLLDFKGTMLLVSHDRVFLNNLVTGTLVLDGSGRVGEYIGGYDDWQSQKQAEEKAGQTSVDKTANGVDRKVTQPSPSGVNGTGRRKLSNKEQRALEAQQRELEELPARIEKLEGEQKKLSQAMADAAFYQRDSEEIALDADRMKQLEAELEEAFRRWEELESMLG